LSCGKTQLGPRETNMSETADRIEEELPLEGAGDRLRHAREKTGKAIGEVAKETRIPQRHLETLEAGHFADLPSRTYAIGFSRTYARAVGLNENEIVDMVRAELAEGGNQSHNAVSSFEPGDPARIPGRGLAWFSAFAALLLLVGLFAFFGDRIFPGAGPGSILPNEKPAAAAPSTNASAGAAPASAAPAASGTVVFTALDDNVWVRFTDADGNRLLEKQLTKGETFSVPADAKDPRINTGRPDLLGITVGGRSVAKLAEEPVTIADAQVSAAALAARQAGPAEVSSQ
jgi:hypothetical protein